MSNTAMKLSRRKLLVAGLTAALPMPALAAPSEKITFVTDYGFYGRQAFMFVALKKGLYAQQGLDVSIVRGQGSFDAIKQVAAGRADFGVADAGSLILSRANDQIPVKITAIIYAKLSQAITVLEKSGIRTPKDLEGKTLASAAQGTGNALFNLYAQAAGIDATKINWISIGGDALASVLVSGKAAGTTNYTVAKPLIERLCAPEKVLNLGYADVGLDAYSNGLIASEAMLATKPDTIKRLTQATLAGLTYAMANPGEAGDIIHEYHRDIDADIATEEMKIVTDLAQQAAHPVGYIDPARMTKTVDLVAKLSALKTQVKPADVYMTL